MVFYKFRYLDEYYSNVDSVEIAPMFPMTQQEYVRPGSLFYVFAGLLPEGSLRAFYCKQARIGDDDHYGLLLYANSETVGAFDFEEIPPAYRAKA